MCKCKGEMGLYNRFGKRFFAAVIIRLTAQSDSRAPLLSWQSVICLMANTIVYVI